MATPEEIFNANFPAIQAAKARTGDWEQAYQLVTGQKWPDGQHITIDANGGHMVKDDGFWKKVGSAALGVAPIATAFIPGVGPLASLAIGAGTGAAKGAIEGGGLKGALTGAATGAATSAIGGATGKLLKGAAGGGGSFIDDAIGGVANSAGSGGADAAAHGIFSSLAPALIKGGATAVNGVLAHRAAGKATDQLVNASERAQQINQQVYNDIQSKYAPYIQGGQGAFGMLTQGVGVPQQPAQSGGGMVMVQAPNGGPTKAVSQQDAQHYASLGARILGPAGGMN